VSRIATISAVIDADVKKAASQYCKRHGIKLQYFIERALVDQLEDEIDLAAYLARKGEATVPLDELLGARRRRKS
jgi:hypothetical protein